MKLNGLDHKIKTSTLTRPIRIDTLTLKVEAQRPN